MIKTQRITLAASKSYLQRAMAIAALADGTSVLNNVTCSKDSAAAKRIIENLGCKIQQKNDTLFISPQKTILKDKSFNAGESALSIRMFSPILALKGEAIYFTGEGSLKTRPLDIITDALSLLAVDVESNNGFLPLKIKGPIQAGNIKIDASLSSQVLTGLLIALPLVQGDSIIEVENLKSKPYIDMTLSIMAHFGVVVENKDYKIFKIKGGQKYKASNYDIEGDWSAGAFFLVYGAVKGAIEIPNLDAKSAQADVAIISALKKAGATVSILPKGIAVHQKTPLKAFNFDATNCPDLFPPLICLASQCQGTSKIKGASRLRYKESDRAKSLMQIFTAMGINISLQKDEIHITGGQAKACTIDSHQDHRIAMAGGLMNLFCEGEIKIKNKEVVDKSYPHFFEDLNKIVGYNNP